MARNKHDIENNIEKHKRTKEIIEKHPTVASLSQLFFKKGERDLQVATANFNLGLEEKHQNLQSSFFNWVTVISYYSMFHCARPALSKISVYVSDENVHETVLNGMYHYYVYEKRIEKKLYYMLEDAKMAKDKAIELIEKLEHARTKRGNVNYEVAQAISKKIAKEQLDDAKVFINAMRELIR